MTRTIVVRLGRILLVVLALVGVTACKSITNSVHIQDLVGFWVASEARFADPGNPNHSVDLIALDWTATMSIEADGSYTIALTAPGEMPTLTSGTVEIEGTNDVVLHRAGADVGEGEVFLEDDQVAFLFDEFAGFEWDLHGNGRPVPVTLLLVMDR